MILLQPGIALQKLLVQKCDGTASAAGIACRQIYYGWLGSAIAD